MRQPMAADMELRDFIAANLYEVAMKIKPPGPRGMIEVAEKAYELADNMLEARMK